MKTVLLVDDEKETSTVFQTGIKAAGYNVILAENGTDALDKAKKGGIDVILLDQMMPDISGNEVLRTLKQDDATKSIPIAMLTNFGHDEMVKEALNLGANDYILKYRVEPKDLVLKIKRLTGEDNPPADTQRGSWITISEYFQ
ncbi:MAG TPA: response regulator, partial [Patescibacteria group bacterium]|nr:response regulator [Patescibacteria group bacterium]